MKAEMISTFYSPEYRQTLTVYAHAVLSISLVVLQRVSRHVSSAVHDSAVQAEPGTLLGVAHYGMIITRNVNNN